MKFMEKVWDNLGLLETAGEEEEEKEKKSEPERRTKRNKTQTTVHSAPTVGNNVVSLPTLAQTPPSLNAAGAKQLKVMVVEPVSFDDAQDVADYLKVKKPVVINFENTDAEISRRMIDFISGTAYALNGSIQKVGNHIFLCAPHNVDVDYTPRSEQPGKDLFPGIKHKFGDL